ncbi:NAD kinase [Tepidimonas charontis]|uniref:NAD kinase n=1 Tax=Tepidimonas charontis TaxID=2267262 RepID=A0A554XFN9_9BURK|nr:NAD kinase [Tepidimonas charontis]TSE34653.1 NAD kinase [Tepidimonas charontis]
MNPPAVQPLSPSASAPRARPFQRVALVGKYHAGGSREALAQVVHFLHEQGCDVTLERDTALHLGPLGDAVRDVAGIGAHCELALVVGGDGTMLGIGRQLAPYGVPLVGINQGRLGFITDIPFERFAAVLQPMLRGAYEEEQRALMQASVWRDGACIFQTIAMNDVVVNRGGAPSMVELRVEVDGHFVANQRADGLIIASPTGSTAYALSAGGPLLHPAIAGWVMVPIAPHTLSNRPIVLPSDGEIAIVVVAGREPSAHFDMQTFTSLLPGDRIVVRRSAHTLRLLHPQGWSYFDTLRRKLHWNEGVVA